MLIVGIAGGTGSGKTTVVKKVMSRFPNEEVIVIPQDAYYKDNGHIPLEERQKINFDHPDSLEFSLLIEHLKRLKTGQSIEMPIYSYLTCLRSKETITVKPARVVLVEGILILADSGLRDILDIKVFVDADADDRLEGLSRDIVERGFSTYGFLDNIMILLSISSSVLEPSKRYADIIPERENQVRLVLISIMKTFVKI
jgi:uridine kinase